ncbi:MAG: DarT ssDNA thymidine ADP-ribosyltransferase family protein [Candidatus Scalindua sp.]
MNPNDCICQLKKFNITRLFYLTYIENINSIINNGILSKNETVNREIKSTSFAFETVQERRDSKTIELSNNLKIPLHDLVPLYMTPRTPTLSRLRDKQDKLAFIVIDAQVICDEKTAFAFTDGSAAAHHTKSYSSLFKLSEIPWNVVNADRWTELEDGRRKRNAEFLIYPRIEARYIIKFVVENFSSGKIVRKITSSNSFNKKIVRNAADYFFPNNDSIPF